MAFEVFDAQNEEKIKRCHYAAQVDRIACWQALHDEIPIGQRVGWTCKVAYCWNPEHMALVENKNSRNASYAKFHQLLGRLKIGEVARFSFPRDDRLRRNLRCGLQQRSGKIRFTLRALEGDEMELKRIDDWF